MLGVEYSTPFRQKGAGSCTATECYGKIDAELEARKMKAMHDFITISALSAIKQGQVVCSNVHGDLAVNRKSAE